MPHRSSCISPGVQQPPPWPQVESLVVLWCQECPNHPQCRLAWWASSNWGSPSQTPCLHRRLGAHPHPALLPQAGQWRLWPRLTTSSGPCRAVRSMYSDLSPAPSPRSPNRSLPGMRQQQCQDGWAVVVQQPPKWGLWLWRGAGTPTVHLPPASSHPRAWWWSCPHQGSLHNRDSAGEPGPDGYTLMGIGVALGCGVCSKTCSPTLTSSEGAQTPSPNPGQTGSGQEGGWEEEDTVQSSCRGAQAATALATPQCPIHNRLGTHPNRDRFTVVDNKKGKRA